VKRAIFLLPVFLPVFSFAKTPRIITGTVLSKEDSAAVNINFEKMDNELSNTVTKASTQTITGRKYFTGAVNLSTVTVYSLTASTLTTTSLVNGSPLCFRNKIINGAMEISQRYIAVSTTPGTGTGAYIIDRFFISYSSTSKLTSQQVSDAPAGFSKSLKLTVAGAVTPGASSSFFLGQAVEGYNIQDINFGSSTAKTLTLSFWVKSSVAGTYAVGFTNGGTRSYVATYSISNTGTWEQKQITLTADTGGVWQSSNTAGLSIQWGLGAGSTYETTAGSWQAGNFFQTSGATDLIATNSATFQLTGVQLEIGTMITPFERLPITTTLELCQRYYEKSYDQTTAPGATSVHGSFWAIRGNGGFGGSTVYYHVTKRTTPTVTAYSHITGAAGFIRNERSGADEAQSIAGGSNDTSVAISGTTGTNQDVISFQWTAEAEF
jgi:hypothetical protein